MRISIIIALSCHLNRNIVLNTDPATQRSVLEEFGILADECSVLQSVKNGSFQTKFSNQYSLATGNPMQGIACGQPESVRDTYEIKNVVEGMGSWLSHLQRLL
jgi:hypothetical protein